MTRLYDIPHGQILQFERLLVDRGDLKGEEVEAILRQPELVDAMVTALREQLAPPLFCTPEEILARFTFYAGNQGWPVTNLIDQLTEQMPTDHVSSLNSVLALDVWLGDLPTTFEALAGWIKHEQHQAGNGFWRYDGLLSDAKHLRLLNPDRYGTEPSVRWVKLDMLAHWDKRNGTRPRDVRDSSKSAGLQVMTAFAVHPAYPPAIDYETIPGAWLPGLQATIPGSEAWTLLPILYWNGDDREVGLGAYWDDDRYRFYAVPEFREL